MGADKYEDPDCPEAAAGLDEPDPQEEAGAERCDAEIKKCEHAPGVLDGQAQECEFTIMDELHEQLRVDPMPVMIDPIDGLPHPVTKDNHPAPPFTYDTVNCVEDDRVYVELFADELAGKGWFPNDPDVGTHLRDIHYREEVEYRDVPATDDAWETAPSAIRFVESYSGRAFTFLVRCRFDPDGRERRREQFEPKEVESRHGMFVVIPEGEEQAVGVPVRPIRERCRNYKRMCMANDDQPDPTAFMHFIVFRNCMARRSVGGAFLGLRDEAVYGCDHRDPPDTVTVNKHLDGPDRRKLVNRPDLELVPLFGLDGDTMRRQEGSGR